MRRRIKVNLISILLPTNSEALREESFCVRLLKIYSLPELPFMEVKWKKKI